MKIYPEHILAEQFLTAGGNEDPTDGSSDEAGAEHPLAQELRRVLRAGNATDVGTYARLVEKIMTEMTMVREQMAPGHDGLRLKAGQ